MAGKYLIECELVTITGMHIGGTDTFSAIGAVDSPVIKDALTGRPIVRAAASKENCVPCLPAAWQKILKNCRNLMGMPSRSRGCSEALIRFGPQGRSLRIAFSRILTK